MMRSSWTTYSAKIFLLMGLVGFLAGCSSTPPPETSVAHFKVTYQGKDVNGVILKLKWTSGDFALKREETVRNGELHMAQLTPGTVQIAFAYPPESDKAMTMKKMSPQKKKAMEDYYKKMGKEPVNVTTIPEKYLRFETSGISKEIKLNEENNFEIVLK